jgi:hypothetical protein
VWTAKAVGYVPPRNVAISSKSFNGDCFNAFMVIQSVPKRYIHIIKRNINLVYTSFWGTLYNYACLTVSVTHH